MKEGPFTEVKEVVGGFFIIEAASVEVAVKMASLHPAAALRLVLHHDRAGSNRPAQKDLPYAQAGEITSP